VTFFTPLVASLAVAVIVVAVFFQYGVIASTDEDGATLSYPHNASLEPGADSTLLALSRAIL
jgi:hypothetical protein